MLYILKHCRLKTKIIVCETSYLHVYISHLGTYFNRFVYLLSTIGLLHHTLIHNGEGMCIVFEH